MRNEVAVWHWKNELALDRVSVSVRRLEVMPPFLQSGDSLLVKWERSDAVWRFCGANSWGFGLPCLGIPILFRSRFNFYSGMIAIQFDITPR